MNLFMNHFAFFEPKSSILSSDVVEALDNLGNLFIALQKINVEISIHQSFSEAKLIGKPIREYIKNIEDANSRMSIVKLIHKTSPICSDTDTPYEDDTQVILGNCVEEKEKIDVLQTFLSCAMYYNNPILTINNLCSKSQFFEDTINIICDEEKKYTLNNYQLIPYLNVVKKIKISQKEDLSDHYNDIDNWNDYKDFINPNFEYIRITGDCMNEIERRYSYNNSYSSVFRNKIKRFNTLIKQNGGEPKKINFKSLGLGRPESETRFTKLKKSHIGIKDFSGNTINLNWHEYILDDFRLYFEIGEEYVSFVHYEKKIN